MKTPGGTIDLIGTGMQIGLGVIDLVKTFSRTPEERRIYKSNRKIKVAVRRLKHRFKTVPVSTYVAVNFPDLDTEQRISMVNYLDALLEK